MIHGVEPSSKEWMIKTNSNGPFKIRSMKEHHFDATLVLHVPCHRASSCMIISSGMLKCVDCVMCLSVFMETRNSSEKAMAFRSIEMWTWMFDHDRSMYRIGSTPTLDFTQPENRPTKKQQCSVWACGTVQKMYETKQVAVLSRMCYMLEDRLISSTTYRTCSIEEQGTNFDHNR